MLMRRTKLCLTTNVFEEHLTATFDKPVLCAALPLYFDEFECLSIIAIINCQEIYSANQI